MFGTEQSHHWVWHIPVKEIKSGMGSMFVVQYKRSTELKTMEEKRKEKKDKKKTHMIG